MVGESVPSLASCGMVSRTGLGWRGGDDGVLDASSCSAGRGREKRTIPGSPKPSRAGLCAASPYYHVGRYREGIPDQRSWFAAVKRRWD